MSGGKNIVLIYVFEKCLHLFNIGHLNNKKIYLFKSMYFFLMFRMLKI